jgi:hypothetical protein
MKIWNKANVQASRKHKAERRKFLSKQWDAEKTRNVNFGMSYEKKSRDHNARQKGAKEELVALLTKNGRRSYSALGKAMNNWCSLYPLSNVSLKVKMISSTTRRMCDLFSRKATA